MKSNTATLKVNPRVLHWAREESGYSIPEISTKLSIDTARYLEWESEGLDIPYCDLKTISDTFKVQVAAFFLPEAPKKRKQPTDFRNIETAVSQLSKKTLLSIRLANNFREVLLELNGEAYYQQKYEWLNEYEKQLGSSNISRTIVTNTMRKLLNFSMEDQLKDKTMGETYHHWRNSVEYNLGIYVFQLNMPKSEVQGFCYSDSYPYCIVVNGRYPVSSRIFTIFHELGHIIKKQSGLCLPDAVSDEDNLEFECNSFAGRIIVPDEMVVPTLNKDKIFELATKLKVSSEVYLRRLKSLGKVTDAEFFPLLEEIHNSIKPSKPGRTTPLNKSINSRGQSLFNTLVEAANSNKISYSRAAGILDLKVNYLLGP